MSVEDPTVSWRELLAGATGRLDAMDARRIVAECLGAPVSGLEGVLDAPATVRGVAQLDQLVARRAAGEPLQYVLGSWGFRTLDLMVDRRVLIPRPETESVVEAALAELDRIGVRDRPTTVVDLGTGSGAIALSNAVERPRATVWGTDRSAAALEVAAANTAAVGRVGARVRLSEGEWYSALPAELLGRVDLIVSNPPYVADDAPLPPEVEEWEPVPALRSGAEGTDDLRAVLGGAGEWLTDGGVLVCELSPEQADPMGELARQRFASVRCVADLTGRDRALVATDPLRGG